MMKFNKAIAHVAVMITALFCAVLPACGSSPQRYVQELNYTESIDKINNPDQGFYRPIFVAVTENGVSYNKNIINASTQLYHLRIDISAFSKAVNGDRDKPLSQASLDGLETLLTFLKEQDKNAVVRFAYDPYYGGKKDNEPAPQMILTHIKQICPLLNRFETTVTAVEAGLIGPWGEMHSSAIANAEHISPIIDTFLSCTENTSLLVRTPKMIYDYLGITLDEIDGYRIDKNNMAYRLGLFNDGYLGSDSDLGTYRDRAREIEFLSAQTAHLPYGGEVTVPNSALHDIETCLPEMHKLDLSYLNIEWNNQVIEKWKNSVYTQSCGADAPYYGKNAFEYIDNHLGYRFVLKKSVFEYSRQPDELKIELTLDNVGFGNLNKPKHAKIILTDENGAVVSEQSVKDFTGDGTYECSVALNLKSGNYAVYLRLYGEESQTPLYCIQFANCDIWNAELKANKIGSVTL